MKFKKIFLGLTVMMAFLAGGCSQQKKKAEPILTKNQVIEKSQKGFKSGQVIQSLRLSTDTSSQLVIANTTFGGNPTVFHINNQTTAKGKTRSLEQWVSSSNNAYINGSSTWYKADLQKLSGHSYAELLDAITNNKVIFNPDATLKNAYKMKRNKQTYTLTAKTTDPKMMKATADDIVATVGQSPDQEKVFKNIQKYGKYRNMTVTMVVKNKKLFSCNIFVNMTLGKFSKVRLGQSFGNFGKHDFLKIPNNALNAKPLPMVKEKKETKSKKETKKKNTKKTTKKTTKAKTSKKDKK